MRIIIFFKQKLIIFIIPNYYKMQDYLKKLEKELAYRNYSPRTIDLYTMCLKYFLNYIKNDPTQIHKETIVDFILHLQKKNKAPKTINCYKEAIKFFTQNILKEPIHVDIKLSREAKKLPVVLTKNEILKLIEHISN